MKRHSIRKRVLAVILAGLLCVSVLIPSSVLAGSSTYENAWTITVLDSENVAVSGAEVSYEVFVDTASNASGTETTAADGSINVAAIAGLTAEIEANQVSVSYTVTAAGYETASGSFTVTSATTNETVVLTASVVQMKEYMITVQSGVGGTVTLDGETVSSKTAADGAQVAVSVIPDSGYYLKSLTIGGAAVAVEETGYSGTITISDDTTIVPEFQKYYTVSVNAYDSEAGSVMISDDVTAGGSSIRMDEGTEISIRAEAAENYIISSVYIGGVEQAIEDNAESFSLSSYTVSGDTEITVYFARLYVMTVTYSEGSEENGGAVVTQPGGEVGKGIAVVEDENFTVTATPSEHYRVAQVVKDAGTQDEQTISYTDNDQTYTDTIENISGNHTYVITFARNNYTVTYEAGANGTVSAESETVEYGSAPTVRFTPADGYTVDEVVITESDGAVGTSSFLSDEYGLASDSAENYVMTAEVTGDISVTVSFKQMETMESGTVVHTAAEGYEILRTDSTNAAEIYAGDARVIYTAADYEGIRIYGKTEGEAVSSLKYYNISGNSVTVKDTTITITGIQVLSGKEWKDVEIPDADYKIVFDTTAPTGRLTPENPNDDGYYNGDVTVSAEVSDQDDYSGIASVEYAVSDDGNEPEQSNRISIYSYDASSGSVEAEASPSLDSFVIDAEQYNTANVKVYLYVADRAGNTFSTSADLAINSTAPVISVSMVEDSENSDEAESSYYSVVRTATITIIDREDTFNSEAATAGISVQAEDASGVSVDNPVRISAWTADAADSSVHTATVSFAADANYEWSVSYTNLAGLSCTACDDTDTKSNVSTESGEYIYEFTVDTAAPELDANAMIGVEDALWKGIDDTASAADTVFSLWQNKEITVAAESQDIIDATSPVKDVLYYVTDAATFLTREELCSLYADGKFTDDAVTVNTDAYVTVYARITDYAGNTLYIGTDGVVVDMSQSALALTPEAASKDNAIENVYGYYTEDVTIDVTATDEIKNVAAYSGIASVYYTITCDGTVTKKDYLYRFQKKNPAQSDLKAEWSGSITVNAEENNSDNVEVAVTVTDNAGNVQTETVYLQINVTKPTATITFDDANSPIYQAVTENDGSKIGYFAKSRTATITITERTSVFDADAATAGISIEAVDAAGSEVSLNVGDMISEWKTTEGDTADEATHTAMVQFETDGVYTWSFSYTDKNGYCVSTDEEDNAGSATDQVTYSGETPMNFAVDQTKPTASLEVNENKWTQLLSKLTFGLFSNVSADVSAEYNDATSPFDVDYYKTSDTVLYTETKLNELFESGYFTSYSDFTVTGNEQFVIYLRVTDYAGNYYYVNSDGYIVDTQPSVITLTPSAPAADNGVSDVYGYYKDDVTVNIDISESDTDYSGIQLIEYWITDGTEIVDSSIDKMILYEYDYTRDTGENNNGGTLIVTEMDCNTGESAEMTYSGTVPAQELLKQSWSGYVTVDADTYNTSEVTVYVRTVDNAGNETTDTVNLDIDSTAPTIDITYNNNTARNGSYFNNVRTATIVITERTNHFDAATATNGITITATDSSGNPVSVGNMISSWTTEEGSTPDEATHTATISYTADANYTFSVSYTDKAMNVNGTPDTGESVVPWQFTVDQTAPTGTLTALSKEGRTGTWDRLLSSLTYGFYSGESITVTSTQADATSPIESVKYIKTASYTVMTQSQLEAVSSWSDFSSLTVKGNEQFVVYLQITDYAGNVTYLCSDGLIVDDTAPVEEKVAPEVTISPEQPVNGYYNGNVNVPIQVTDPTSGNTYSGLNEVRYEVLNMGKVTQSGILYSFTDESPSISSLLQTWSGSITVNASLNNSNDVVIIVYAADNSGNTSQKSVAIQIDVTAPVIDISYNNNSPDSGSYYNSDRVATVVVTERNFNADDVIVNITNTDGAIPVISGWTTVQGSGNGDGTTHTATITYSADGDYTFDVAYTDRANNPCTAVNFAVGTANPTEFTIDKTNPRITVSYNNNTVNGDRYFSASRTATVTVTEHNFDVNRVVFTQTASLDGNAIAIPGVSWSNSGDVHTATITYSTDGDYTFDVTMTDMAGNESGDTSYGNSVAAKEFTVDLTIEKPIISGVENGVSYKGDVIPAVDFRDINYDSYEITLLRTRKNVIDEDVTDKFITAVTTTGYGGQAEFDTFEKTQENDGIYTLTVTVWDKAGNEETETIVFTVNRFGSVYAFNQALVDLQDAYVQAVDEELVITEYNPDRLLQGSLTIEVTRDGAPMNDVNYEVSPVINEFAAVGTSGWYQYEYTIDTTNFEEDGIYSIVVSSEDEAGNLPETSNYEDCEVLFRVDTTAAEITNVSGLEESIVNAESVDVSFEVFDSIGLASATVYINGSEYQTWAGEEIEGLNTYEGTFTIEAASSAQSVRFVIVDLAGNVLDTDDQNSDGSYSFAPGFAFNRTITISTNFFVRWYANKPAFYGTIIVVVVVVALIIFGVVYKKRKNENAEDTEASA